jgi:hypothetical protein
MSILNQFWDKVTGKQHDKTAVSAIPYDYNPMYDAFYDEYNNDAGITADDTTRRLRTVVNRSVEFYASKMMPGEKIEVIADKPGLKDALDQIIKDSNLGNNKPAMLRGFALYGDSFVRVRGDDQKSYLEDISPFYLTDFAEDSRGFLTYCRIDIPILDDNNNPANYTEYWDLESKTLRIWKSSVISRATLTKDLGPAQETHAFSEYGIDFIPIVHTKFRDNGDARGLSCFYHAQDKIYEANRMATRLHDILFAFGQPIFVVSANDKDQAGRPLPPPSISTGTSGSPTVAEAEKEDLLGGRLMALPGVSTVEALIPNIDYSDALAILNAQMQEIEDDLPELRYYSLQQDGSAAAMSGAAIRSLLGAAIDRANEAKNNFVSSLSRMLEMALTIGIYNRVFPASLGQFDKGDFDHQLEVGDAWAASIDDKAATMTVLTGAGVPAPAAMKLCGFTDEQVAEAFPQGMSMPKPQLPSTNPFQKGQNGQNMMLNGKQAIKVN